MRRTQAENLFHLLGEIDDEMLEAEVADSDDSVGDWVADWEEVENQDITTDRRVDFIHQLTDEQLGVVFPDFGAELSATALFSSDGILIEVVGIIEMPVGEQIRVRVAENEIEHDLISSLLGESLIHLVHGVEITVYEQGSASFMLENIAYYIEVFDETVVNQIILGGPADLSVLSNLEM